MGFWEITIKDLKLQMRDRRALSVLLAFPICFIAILGLSTGKLLDLGNDSRKFKVAIVDNDGGEMAARIIATLEKRKGLIVQRFNESEARKLLDDDVANAILFIGENFTKRYEALKLRDILDTTSEALAEGIGALDMRLESGGSAFSATMSNIEQLVFVDSLRHIAVYVACQNRLTRLRIKRRCDELYPREGAAPADPAVEDEPDKGLEPVPDPMFQPEEDDENEAAKEPEDDIYRWLVPSYTVMFVFFLVNIMSRSFIHERSLGTLRRLRIAPIRPTSLLLGKTIPFYFISLLQSALLFLFGRILFGMSWGSMPWALLPVIVCTSLAATALGLLVATLVRTDAQVSAYANMVVIVMAGISGCFMPRQWLPNLMRDVSLGTPHAWALIAYRELLEKDVPNLATVTECCGWMVGFAAVYFVLGALRFGRVD